METARKPGTTAVLKCWNSTHMLLPAGCSTAIQTRVGATSHVASRYWPGNVCMCVRVCVSVCVCLLRVCVCVRARARVRAYASRYLPGPLCLPLHAGVSAKRPLKPYKFLHLARDLYLYDLVRCTIAPAHLRVCAMAAYGNRCSKF